jgi:hypothetical protein
MAIINTSPTQINTPFIITETDATPPAIDSVPDGTLYFYRDSESASVSLFQSFLSKGTWAPIGGGSGATPEWATVLAVGANLSDNVSSDANGFTFEMINLNRGTFSAQNGANVAAVNIQTNFAYIGATDGSVGGCYLFFEPDNALTYTAYTQGSGYARGFLFDFAAEQYKFGDVAGLSNATRIEVLDKSNAINHYSDVVYFEESNIGSGILDFSGTGWTSATSGTNASLHLKVRINGTIYKIQLKNNA